MERHIPIRNKSRITNSNVYSESEALLYITDCELATVSHMASLKSKRKGEYDRHISIAQKAINWIYAFKIPVDKGSRVHEILMSSNMNVAEWAKKYET